MTAYEYNLEVGSSPLTRGKPNSSRQRLVAAGLIPAHAGKTGWILICVSSGRAHPRSRGENHAAFLMYSYTVGSSPLTRGKPRVKAREVKRGRLIPAHAGKTRWARCERSGCAAHPRSRGENPSSTTASGIGSGSSPLTRGKPVLHCVCEGAARLIPAHAGKTPRRARQRSRAGAHPRSRGENRGEVAEVCFEDGSSPLTRGKRHDGSRLRRCPRLIPAHAGKTVSAAVGVGRPSAHPRSRGENTS